MGGTAAQNRVTQDGHFFRHPHVLKNVVSEICHETCRKTSKTDIGHPQDLHIYHTFYTDIIFQEKKQHWQRLEPQIKLKFFYRVSKKSKKSRMIFKLKSWQAFWENATNVSSTHIKLHYCIISWFALTLTSLSGCMPVSQILQVSTANPRHTNIFKFLK